MACFIRENLIDECQDNTGTEPPLFCTNSSNVSVGILVDIKRAAAS
jgi:hypothetical protein